MNKALIIDDMRNIIPVENDPSIIPVYARTSSQAIKLLDVDTLPYTQIWFDHDLGGEDTIRPVIRYMEERWHEGDPIEVEECFVHTSNPVGAQWIMDSLETMGYRYRRYFFQEGEVTIKPLTLMNLLWQYLNVTGGAEARRLVMQGGVKFNDEMMTDLERLHQPLPTEDLTVRVGKWREAKLEGGQVVDVITLR